MNKSLLALFASSILISPLANADDLGVSVGINNTFSNDSSSNIGVEASFEHFIPLLPNVSAELYEVESNNLKHQTTNVNFYYQLLDNDSVEIDLGLGYFGVSGSERLNGSDYDKSTVSATGAVRLGITESIHLYGNINYIPSSELKGHDFEAGIDYEIEYAGLDLNLKAGYQSIQHKLSKTEDNPEFDLSGIKLGLAVGF